ncbi:MAG: pyridoxine 5-phosphate synthase [Flavobacteriales bacterium]|jgi:pyridoxine 5-phosphate synthase
MEKNSIRLSVNINKIATLRNARGGNTPSVTEAAVNCEEFGAQGITVHPRPDERHIRYADVHALKPLVTTEFNVEGYPNESFLKLVEEVRPHQVTLVPDPPGALTSNAGWDTVNRKAELTAIIQRLKKQGIRTSIFIGTNEAHIRAAAETGTDRVELYTEPFADLFPTNKEAAIEAFVRAGEIALEEGLGLNAGHDLNLHNLRYFAANVPGLKEVSIGHALISNALYYGLENTVQLYLKALEV